MVSHEEIALHRADAVADGMEKLYLEQKGVARHHFLPELNLVYAQEICRPPLGLLNLVQHQQAATLCHGLNLQDTRHDGLLWEMSDKERLV